MKDDHVNGQFGGIDCIEDHRTISQFIWCVGECYILSFAKLSRGDRIMKII
jgi:hypothetical protein